MSNTYDQSTPDTTVLPRARDRDLVIQEVEDETLVYDLRDDKAYCLNTTASLVWSYCDGKTSAGEVVSALEQELGPPVDEELVRLALRRLDRAHLLQDRLKLPDIIGRITRREFLRKAGIAVAAGVLLPTVISIVAPTAAQAATCVTDCADMPQGTPCNPPDCVKICCGADPSKRKCRSTSHQSCA